MVSDHSWKVRCWKSARRCGAKHVSKSKCTKQTSSGPLLEVEIKCTPLWREAHFEVKSGKNWGGSKHFWAFGCRFEWHAQGILPLAKSKQNVRVLSQFQLESPLHYTPLHYTYNYTTFITLHYITLQSTTLHYWYTTLRYTQFHHTTLH